MAQWIEHLTTDQKVGGSSPFGRATNPSNTAKTPSVFTRVRGVLSRNSHGMKTHSSPVSMAGV